MVMIYWKKKEVCNGYISYIILFKEKFWTDAEYSFITELPVSFSFHT